MVTALFPFARYDVSLARPHMSQRLEGSRVERWPHSHPDVSYMTPIDAWANDDEVVVTAAVPGVHPDNIEITILKNTVTLRGSRPTAFKQQEAGTTWYVNELGVGEFKRTIQFPFELDAEGADAQFLHGLLRVRVPKAQGAKPTRLSIRVEPTGELASLDRGASTS
jgi:HSP20 family protein